MSYPIARVINLISAGVAATLVDRAKPTPRRLLLAGDADAVLGRSTAHLPWWHRRESA